MLISFSINGFHHFHEAFSPMSNRKIIDENPFFNGLFSLKITLLMCYFEDWGTA